MTAPTDPAIMAPGHRVQRIAPNRVGCFDRGVIVDAYFDIREVQWSHGGRAPGVVNVAEIEPDREAPDRCPTCGELIEAEHGTAGSSSDLAVWCDHCKAANAPGRHYGEGADLRAAFSAAWPGPDIAGAMLGAGYHVRQHSEFHSVKGRAWIRKIGPDHILRVTSREWRAELPTRWDDAAVTLLRHYFAGTIEVHDPAPTTIGRLLRQV